MAQRQSTGSGTAPPSRNFSPQATVRESHGRRVALVIGNSKYQAEGWSPLPHAANDAADMRDTLARLNFEVIYVPDASKAQMDAAMSQFASRIGRGTDALFYYSGHGIEADGLNYLIPMGATITSKAEAKSRGYEARIVMDTMKEQGANLKLMILDACRDTPFRGKEGLASMGGGGTGAIIAFAAQEGKTASEGSGRNGTFTKHLLAHIVEPGITASEALQLVQIGVAQESQNTQEPFLSLGPPSGFCFVGYMPQATAAQTAPVSAPAPAPAPRPQPAPRLQPAPVPYAPPPPLVPAKCDYCPEMVRLPGLGISIGKYEVTQGQWRALMGSNPSTQCDDCPVTQVSWDDAQAFIAVLNARTGRRFRLPTEKEWYTACQAGKRHEYCGSDNIDAVAWYRSNSEYSSHPVGRKQSNDWGLYDMSGNVWEWTADCFDDDCGRRAVRGGSWYDIPGGVRSAYRSRDYPSGRGDGRGFRLAQD
jgi:formylglycine-generating enzyme required for sulfatase activity